MRQHPFQPLLRPCRRLFQTGRRQGRGISVRCSLNFSKRQGRLPAWDRRLRSGDDGNGEPYSEAQWARSPGRKRRSIRPDGYGGKLAYDMSRARAERARARGESSRSRSPARPGASPAAIATGRHRPPDAADSQGPLHTGRDEEIKTRPWRAPGDIMRHGTARASGSIRIHAPVCTQATLNRRDARAGQLSSTGSIGCYGFASFSWTKQIISFLKKCQEDATRVLNVIL